MAKQVSKSVIGGFVISAIALLIIAIVVFGGGRFFTKTTQFVLFFDGSVKGLNAGAPVDFRGVQIGTVESVVIRADTEKLDVAIPVVIEIEPEQFQTVGKPLPRNTYERAKILIERGLRAQLALESLVTGQLMIQMDFRPDVPARLAGIDVGYPELPTMPSNFEQLTQTLKKVPIEEIFEKLLSAIESIDNVLSAPELVETVRNLKAATDNVNRLIIHVDQQIDPLSAGLQAGIGDARKLMQTVDSEVQPVSTKAQDALVSATNALDTLAGTLKTYEGLVDDRSELRHDLNVALSEIAKAAISIRLLTDYLEQHPEALLQGKGSGGGQ